MPAKRSMIQVYLISMIVLATVPAVSLLSLWMADQYQRHELRVSNWTQSYLQGRKELLEQEVRRTVRYIEFKRVQFLQRLRREMKDRVIRNYRLVEAVYQQRKPGDSKEQLTELIVQLFRSSQYPVEQGGYSVLRMDGTMLFSSGYPMFEGRNIRELEDLQGNNIFQEMTAIVSGRDEGFIEYDGIGAGQDVEKRRSVGYVKYFEPLGLVLASVNFVEVLENNIKQEVISRLQAVSYDPDFAVMYISDASDTVLVSQYDPTVVGGNHSGLQQSLGADFIANYQQAINNAEGELVHYEFTNGSTASPAMSYIYRYPQWGWDISAVFLLDGLSDQLGLVRSNMEAAIKRQLLSIGITLLAIILAAIILARWQARRSAMGFESFTRFFNEASKTDRYIDESSLPYKEFSALADSANSMIDQRRGYEAALRISEQRFGLALEVSKHYLWEIDTQLKTLSMSKGFYEALGYSPSIYQAPQFEFVLQICHPDDEEQLNQAMDVAQSTDHVNQLQYRLRDIQGNYRWFLSRGGSIKKDEQGLTLLSIGTTTDITRQKEQEQELVESRILAEDANHVKSQFVASMSHELRTPLNGILGYAQLLLKDATLSDEQRRFIAAIEQCGDNLLILIADVLDLSDIETTSSHEHEVLTNLAQLLQNVSDIVRYKAQAKGLEYSHELAASLPAEVLLDAIKVKQVLVNLLANAIKFTRQGYVKVAIFYSAPEELCFQVTDTGPGIDADEINRIFKPFQKIKEARLEGSGLGLTICRRLAEAMGGKLLVDSQSGQGSCFSLIVPLTLAKANITIHAPLRLENTKLQSKNNNRTTNGEAGLSREIYLQFTDALSLGDIHRLQTILAGLGDSESPIAWLGRCQQLLDELDLEAVEKLLSEIGREGEMA